MDEGLTKVFDRGRLPKRPPDVRKISVPKTSSRFSLIPESLGPHPPKHACFCSNSIPNVSSPSWRLGRAEPMDMRFLELPLHMRESGAMDSEDMGSEGMDAEARDSEDVVRVKTNIAKELHVP